MLNASKDIVKKVSRSKVFSANMKKFWRLYVLLFLPCVYIIVFYYWPMYGIQIAFKDFQVSKGITGSPWVGIKYFQQFFGSYVFWRVLKNTFLISFTTIAVGFPVPILLAIGMNELKCVAYKKSVQTVTYIPYFISTVVMVGIIYQVLDTRIGIINLALSNLNIQPVNFVGQSVWFLPIYVLSGIWQTAGYSSIIYLAALAGVNKELQEAATLDGASKLKRIWHIDLPHIQPTIIILMILSVGSVMNVDFQKIFLMQNALTLDVSEVISTYVYKVGLTSFQFSYAGAIGLFSSIINMILLFTVNQYAKKFSDVSIF